MLLLRQCARKQTLDKWTNEKWRWHTVLAWGRNLEGQAGVEGQVVVTRPCVVLELHGMNLTGVAASKLTSAVVTANGQVYTWGDGWGGKLGHGNVDSLSAPARVESLVDRVHVTHVSLGDHHSVMCDEHGRVWACGENKEGQCGLGTPLDVIAQQRHLAYYQGAFTSHHHTSSSSGGYTRHQVPQALREGVTMGARTTHRPSHEFVRNTPSTGHAQEDVGTAFTRRLRALIKQQDTDRGARYRGPGEGRRHSGRVRGGASAGAVWATHQHQTVAAASGMAPGAAAAVTAAAASVGRVAAGGGEGGMAASWGSTGWLMPGGPSGALAWGGSDVTAHLTARGAQPGHQVTPARLGRDHHPLAHTSHASHLLGMAGAAELAVALDTLGESRGIDGHRVVGLAAGRHFSVAVDGDGQVWTWGACFNGCLGSHNSWVSGAQRVDGRLAATLDAEGGAVAVAAGGTFALAITGTANVVVWGTPPVPSQHKQKLMLSRTSHASTLTKAGAADAATTATVAGIQSQAETAVTVEDTAGDGDVPVTILSGVQAVESVESESVTSSMHKAGIEADGTTTQGGQKTSMGMLTQNQPVNGGMELLYDGGLEAGAALGVAVEGLDVATNTNTNTNSVRATTTTINTHTTVSAPTTSSTASNTGTSSGTDTSSTGTSSTCTSSTDTSSTDTSSTSSTSSASTGTTPGTAATRLMADGDLSRVRLEAGLIPGLPPITHIAAGQQHALLSDGRRVWLFGRSLAPDGSDSDLSATWDAPVEVLDTKGAGVRALRAGSHASAVVTQTGELWMWGRLLDASHANTLVRRVAERNWPHREMHLPEDHIWDWAGFGGARPALVTGISGHVVDVALGGWHTLVLVE